MEKVSIIIPSYNCGPYLEDAVASALNQTYDNFEIVVVNDGSTDNTEDVIKRFIKENPEKIKYFYQDNKGLPVARNKAIKESQGEYIALLDADDELMPDALEKCVMAMKHANAEWCISDLLHVDSKGEEVYFSEVPQDNYILNILKKDFVRISPLFRKKSLFDVGLYDENQLVRVDWNLNIKLFKVGKKFVYINEPLYKYKIREKSMVKSNLKNVLFFTKRILKRHHKSFADNGNIEASKIYAYHLRIIAWRYFSELCDFIKGTSCLLESIRYYLIYLSKTRKLRQSL